jgi:hypothetical protein
LARFPQKLAKAFCKCLKHCCKGTQLTSLTGLRQKTIRKQPQTQVAQGIYTKHEKIAETQVYQENYQIEVKPLLYIGLRLFLTKKCLSPVKKVQFLDFFPTGKKARSFGIANSFWSFIPSFGSSSQSLVVDQTHTAHCPSQEFFLLSSWVKAKLVGAFSQTSHYTKFNVKRKAVTPCPAFLPSA